LFYVAEFTPSVHSESEATVLSVVF